MKHVSSRSPGAEEFANQRYVIVKFRDELKLPEGNFSCADLAHQLPPGVPPISNSFKFIPHLTDAITPDLLKLLKRASENHPEYSPPNLLNYSRIEVGDDAEGERLATMVRQWNVTEDRTVVDYAYLHPGPKVPPMSTPAQAIQQAHLEDAPEGIGANYAHTKPGGRGEDVCLADVEKGWNSAHADLVGHNFVAVNPDFYREIGHGTAVLGIIAARDNGLQCLGIAPGIDRIVTVGTYSAANVYVADAAVLAASQKLAAGDVLLIEAQSRSFGGLIPLEAEQAVADMVELARKSHIVVVAAAGNGARNLDTLTDDNNNLLFKEPSGTIIVAGGKRDAQSNWVREENSNFGNRVDCFAQGLDVATLYSYNPWDTTGTILDFGGTSSAAAIVAGAVVCIQGFAFKKRGQKLTPSEVRDLLTDKNLNTGHATYSDEIGLMPDLKGIFAQI